MTREINLTDLPDDILHKIFGYLTVFNRIDAYNVDSKMVIFQKNNYVHIFDRIRAEFATVPNASIIDILSKQNFYIHDSIFTIKNPISKYDKYKLPKLLSKKYARKVVQFIQMICTCKISVIVTVYKRYIHILRLVAEFVYCSLLSREINLNLITFAFSGDPNNNYDGRYIIRKLLLTLMLVDTDYDYYYTNYKFGILLDYNQMIALKDRYESINRIYIDFGSPPNFSFVTPILCIYYMELGKFMMWGDKGMLPLNSIQYMNPSYVNQTSLKILCNQIFNSVLPEVCRIRKSNGDSLGTNTRVSYKNIMDLLIKQSKRSNEDVYQQVLTDSKKCYIQNMHWKYNDKDYSGIVEVKITSDLP